MSPQLLRRIRTGVALILGLLSASTLLGGAASAQVITTESSDSSEPTLSGYQGTAATSGLFVFYNPEGVLPISPILGVGVPDALATIAAGPATFARASVADPGDLIANPDAILTLLSPDYPSGTVPPYPYRVSATSGVGEPRASVSAAPGLDASAEVTATGSKARANTPRAVAPAIVTLGSLMSEATTEVTATEVKVRARTEMSKFDLLGLIKIESIVTDLTAVSDGGETKLTGGTTIAGATMMGRPITIDATGIHTTDEPPANPGPGGLGGLAGLGGLLGGRDALTAPLEDLLEQAGIRITLAGPVEQKGGGAGRRATTGLRIELEFSERTVPVLGPIADLVPAIDLPVPGLPLTIADVLALARAQNIVSLDIGRASVALSARKTTPVDESVFDTAPFDDSSFGTGGFDTGSYPDVSLSQTPTRSLNNRVPGAPALAEATPIGSVGAGIGALALLALLAQPFIGDRLARGAASVLSGNQSDLCSREKR